MTTWKLQLKNTKLSLVIVVIAIVLTYLIATEAQAEPKGFDIFSVSKNGQNGQKNSSGSTNPSSSASKPSADSKALGTWFLKYDQLRDEYKPTEKDKVLLTRPLMQQAERVQQWTNTANKVAKNYKLLAKTIRGLTVPTNMSDIKEYRDLMADWYDDAADVYIDLIRPRPAAKTIEDLQEQLDAVKKRSESLANNIANLKNMDRDLRQHYNIQPALQDDAIQQFVRSK